MSVSCFYLKRLFLITLGISFTLLSSLELGRADVCRVLFDPKEKSVLFEVNLDRRMKKAYRLPLLNPYFIRDRIRGNTTVDVLAPLRGRFGGRGRAQFESVSEYVQTLFDVAHSREQLVEFYRATLSSVPEVTYSELFKILVSVQEKEPRGDREVSERAIRDQLFRDQVWITAQFEGRFDYFSLAKALLSDKYFWRLSEPYQLNFLRRSSLSAYPDYILAALALNASEDFLQRLLTEVKRGRVKLSYRGISKGDVMGAIDLLSPFNIENILRVFPLVRDRSVIQKVVEQIKKDLDWAGLGVTSHKIDYYRTSSIQVFMASVEIEKVVEMGSRYAHLEGDIEKLREKADEYIRAAIAVEQGLKGVVEKAMESLELSEVHE